MRLILCSLLAVSAALPQISLQAPVSGFVLDPGTRSLRPVLGLLGGARVGAPVAAGLPVAAVVVQGSRALMTSQEDSPRLFAATGRDRIVELPGLANAGEAYLSRNGAVALARTGAGEWRFFEGVDTQPRAAGVFHRAGPLTVLLDDETGCAYAAGDGGLLERICGDRDSGVVALLPARPAWLEWVTPGRELAAGFADSGRLLRVDTRSGAVLAIDAGLDGIAIARNAGPGRLYLYGGGGTEIHLLDLSSGRKLSLALPAAPRRIDPMTGGAVLLTFDAGLPLLAIEGGEEMRTYFIPATEVAQ